MAHNYFPVGLQLKKYNLLFGRAVYNFNSPFFFFLVSFLFTGNPSVQLRYLKMKSLRVILYVLRNGK